MTLERRSTRARSRAVGLSGMLALVVGTLVAGGLSSAGAASSKAAVRAALPPGKINHVLVIEFENEGYATTFGPNSPAFYLNGTLRKKGELLQNYYATGHNSLDNYISQVSGQAPTLDTQGDCAANGFAYADLLPGTPDADQAANPGQVDGNGCVYPAAVQTIANQLDTKYPVNPSTHVASWRGYDQDMGNTPARDGGVPDPSGGTDCGHPAVGAPDTAELATATDQYTTRHNPFVWFHSIIDNVAECNANVVPLGSPDASSHLVQDLKSEKTTPRFAFITPNLCSDGHDDTCAGTNSAGSQLGGLTGADDFLRTWMPFILGSPAYKSGDTLVVITFDEADVDQSDPTYAAACCHEAPGPNTKAPGDASVSTNTAPGGGQIGALLLAAKYIAPGTVDTKGSYNHYSALRSYEDLLGITTGGADGQGHLGFAAAKGLAPFGKDVFPKG
jgi:phosphatidylinositol-3-phosphatase